MKHIPTGLAAAVVALSLFLVPTAALAATSADADSIIVTYASPKQGNVSLQAIGGVEGALSAAGLDVTGEVAQDADQVTVVAQPTHGQSVDDAVAAALAVDGVTYAQPNYRYELVDDVDEDATSPELALATSDVAGGLRTQAAASFDDPIARVSRSDTAPNQYWLYTARFADAWQKRETNHAVTVAVIDGPMDVSHEDLRGNLLSGEAYDATAGDPHVFDMGTADAGFNDAHATHVAGIVSGVANNGIGIAGASYNARILPIMAVRRAGDTTIGSTATVLAGLNYVKSLAVADNIRVVNVSLRLTAAPMGETDEAVHTAIADLRRDYDIVTVCAGGNYNPANAANHAITDASYPADYDECVSVTALDATNHNWADSEYNASKDISAPGVSVWSTWYNAGGYGSNGPYAAKTGTSMASPMVSAAFALLFADQPSATVDEAAQAIYNTATAISYTSDARDQERERLSGTHGALDADAAISYLEGHSVPRRTFSDVIRGSWYWSSVRQVTDRAIMNGYGDGRFGPDDSLVREQAACILYNYLGHGAIAEPCTQRDVKQGADSWYADGVNWALANGYMSGYSPETFGVGDALTREQMACIIANAAHADRTDADTARLDALPDAGSVSDWARSSVAWALDNGVINGVSQADGSRLVDPQGNVTRGQMAAIMANALEAGLL